MRGGKHGADPQAVQRGRLRAAAPFALVFRFVLVVLFVACAWLRRREAPPHSSMPSTRHGARKILLNYNMKKTALKYVLSNNIADRETSTQSRTVQPIRRMTFHNLC